jgi:hypothetical protein
MCPKKFKFVNNADENMHIKESKMSEKLEA